jgi:membrane protein implicated in regulation of membrane protease activity
MIKNSSASALIWLTAILLGLGLLIMSPAGSFLVFVLAALFAAAPAFFSTKKLRIAAIVLLIAAILLAAAKYPEFQNERNRIERRNKTRMIKTTGTPGSSYRNSAIYYYQQGGLSPWEKLK